MNVTKDRKTSTNELHNWIDAEVPQMIDDEAENPKTEIVIDKETLKQVEKKVTEMLKQYFK